MKINSHLDGFEQALATVPSCALDAAGRRSQKARYHTIAQAITSVRRNPGVVLVDFDERVAHAEVQELISVERECCPSLRFGFDPVARRLDVTAADSAMLPALDAIEAALEEALR